MTSLGIALHPEPEFLELARGAIESRVDFFEVSPEMLWLDDHTPNPQREVLLELTRRSNKPVVAHGLSLSLGSTGDEGRLERHLRRIDRDQAEFGFRWYSDHLGFVAQGGLESVLPLPLPFSQASVDVVAERLRRLGEHVPIVAFENSALLFTLGDPALEPAFLTAVAEAADCSMVLDLHNAYANCLNTGQDLDSWLAGIPTDRVLEIHLSGGSWSDPAWLSGERRYLDTHDGPVPEPVWQACERLLPRCPNLDGVVLEWIGLTSAEASAWEADLARARDLVDARPPPSAGTQVSAAPLDGPGPQLTNLALLKALLEPDPPSALDSADPILQRADPDGLRLTRLIIKRLRFERLLQGDATLRAAFTADPAGFTERFRAYDESIAPTSPWPREEADDLLAFEASGGCG